MTIIEKSINYAEVVNDLRMRMPCTDFIAGAEWLMAELELFLATNPKATTKQITEYLKTL